MTESILTESPFKLIPLGKSGKFAIVDESDYEWLMQWKWHLTTKGYARFVPSPSNRAETKSMFMHRLINQTHENLETDHINQNKLDNRKSNLRSATRSLNAQNRGLFKNNTSKYKGVYFRKKSGKWDARIMIDGQTYFIGFHFGSAEDAAEEYKKFVALPKEKQKQLARNGKQRNVDVGIYWNKRSKKWEAKIWQEGKEYYIGRFANKEDAIAARKNWRLPQSTAKA